MGLDMYYYKATKGKNGLHFFELSHLYEKALEVNAFRSKTREEAYDRIREDNASLFNAVNKYYNFLLSPEEIEYIESIYSWSGLENFKTFEEWEEANTKSILDEMEKEGQLIDAKFDNHNLNFDDLEEYVLNGYSVDVGYQRKANAIHGWIVDNLQDGEDDQRSTVIEKDTMKYFIDLCNQVLENPEENYHLIPPQSGFFFGGTDIDEYYVAHIEEARRIFQNALNIIDFDTEEFHYSCWW